MFYIFIIFTLFCTIAVSLEHRNKKDLFPFYILFVLQTIGLVLFKLSSSLFDYFLIFEIFSLVMYCLSALKISYIFLLKFISYFLVVVFTQNTELYPVSILLSYVVLNVLVLNVVKTKLLKEVKIPLYSFNLFALLSLRELHNFNHDFRWSLCVVTLLIGAVIFYRFRVNKILYIFLNITISVNLLTLNHDASFLLFTTVLLLIYLALSFIDSKISRMTYDNIILLMLTFSLVPLMRSNVVIVIAAVFIFSILNFLNYSSGKYIDG